MAGDEKPKVVFPAIVGHHRRGEQGEGLQFTGTPASKEPDFYVGDYAEWNSRSHKLRCVSPIERGVVTNWDDMEKVYKIYVC